MNRILCLQKLQVDQRSDQYLADSTVSNHCSAESGHNCTNTGAEIE